MSDPAFCLVGFLCTFAFILAFLFVWKLAHPSGEPGIIERAKAARDLYRDATNKGETALSIGLGALIMIKGTKALLIGFFTFLLGSISASICGYDPFKFLERLLDFLERLLFGSEATVPAPTDTTSG